MAPATPQTTPSANTAIRSTSSTPAWSPWPTTAVTPRRTLSWADSCPATDQRGEKRPQDGNGDGTANCDIGAFENDDEVAPTVSVTTRKRSGNATVKFSEPMVPTTLMQVTTDSVAQPSISQSIVMLKGGPASTTQVPAMVSCTDSTCKTVVLDPDKKLAKLKKYTVKVEGAADTDGLAVEDLMSNALVQDHAKSFKTGAR